MGRRILAIRPVLRLCLLLPCGRQGLSAKRASHWQVLSTHTERSGDVMFVLGGLAEENMVPIGASFDNGMRNDCHDAVSAELIIPIGVWSSQPAVAAASAHCPPEPKQPAEAARPAAGGAPQPAVAAAAASQPAVAAASAQQAHAPGHAAEAGRPAAGETMISKQMESTWDFFFKILKI